MKESYQKGVANHLSPESCLDDPQGRGEALTGGSTGGLLSSENTTSRRPSQWVESEGNTGRDGMRVTACSGGVRESGMCGHSPHENRETSGRSLHGSEAAMSEATGKVNSRAPVVGSPEESDGVIVPEKSANKGTTVPAESMEERMPTKRKPANEAALRTLSRAGALNGFRWLRRRRNQKMASFFICADDVNTRGRSRMR